MIDSRHSPGRSAPAPDLLVRILTKMKMKMTAVRGAETAPARSCKLRLDEPDIGRHPAESPDECDVGGGEAHHAAHGYLRRGWCGEHEQGATSCSAPAAGPARSTRRGG